LKVCAKCGFKEYYWRPCHWDFEKEVCNIDDFGKDGADPSPYFVYKKNKSYVFRMDIDTFKIRGWKQPKLGKQGKYKPKPPHRQTTLKESWHNSTYKKKGELNE